MTSFSIQNFGCRVNQAEAFAWAEELGRHGFEREEDSTRADVVVVNSCTLTSRADRDVRKFIRKIARLNPTAKLVIAGCSVEEERAALAELPQTWLIIPNEEKSELTRRVLAAAKRRPAVSPQSLRSRALLKIQDGCNLRCTFCIIPRVRGKSRSCEKEEVLSRIRSFIGQGFREIVLCGIHLSSYGRDLKPSSSLRELLQELTAVEGLGRLRLSSLDPRFSDDELLAFISGSPKICPHFHLSLQHGSDRILKKMGRDSRLVDYGRILGLLRRNSPEASLGADIIVGFPGEEPEDFERTEEFLTESPLSYLHVFSYSPRPRTPASEWPQVSEALKRERSLRLRRLSDDKKRAFRLAFLGRHLKGVVVKKRGEAADVLTGNYIDVRVPRCSKRQGEEVDVRITEVTANGAGGEIVG